KSVSGLNTEIANSAMPSANARIIDFLYVGGDKGSLELPLSKFEWVNDSFVPAGSNEERGGSDADGAAVGGGVGCKFAVVCTRDTVRFRRSYAHHSRGLPGRQPFRPSAGRRRASRV